MVILKRIGETLGVGMEGHRQVSALTDLTENASPSRLAESMKNLAVDRRFMHKLTRKTRHPDFSYFLRHRKNHGK